MAMLSRQGSKDSKGSKPGGAAGTGHPFDDAFSMMLSMQAELKQVKAELHEEKTRRTSEVGELQREVRTLRGHLEQALKDLSAANDRVTHALTSETALRGRALEMLRKEVADAIVLASQVHHLKTVEATHYGKLATELKTERHERQAAQHALDALLSAEVQTRTEECELIGVHLRHLRQQWEENLRKDHESFDSLLKDVHAAGQLLSGEVKDHQPPLGQSQGSLPTTAAGSPLPVGHPADSPSPTSQLMEETPSRTRPTSSPPK